MSGQKRVAITGIGMICALGTQREAVWEHMRAGHCGIGPVTLFDTDGYRSRIAAEVDLSDVQARFTPYQRRRWSRSAAVNRAADSSPTDNSSGSTTWSSISSVRTGLNVP